MPYPVMCELDKIGPRRPLFSILHPTARVKPFPPSLPEGWRHTMQALYDTCIDPSRVEYVVAVHDSQWDQFWQGQLSPNNIPVPWPHFRVVRNTKRDCNVDQLNCAAADSTGLILMGTMDDLFPPPEWDRKIADLFTRGPFEYNEPHIIYFQSGSPMDEQLPQAGIITRPLYERWGYILYPGYESMYADNDLIERAALEGVDAKAFDIAFEHRHPIFGKAETDAVYQDQNAPEKYRKGRALLERRRVAGFKPVPDEPDQRVFACTFPGEWFECQSVVGMLDLQAHLLHKGWFLHISMGHTTNVYCTRIQQAEVILKFEPKPELVLWVDDDNLLSRDQLDLLIADLDARPDLAGVVGWCWCDNSGDDPTQPWMMSCGRQIPGTWTIQRFTREDFNEAAAAGNPLLPLDWSGFPVVLMRRSTLERLTPSAFAPIVRPDVQFGFTSEDAAFFWRAKEAGLQFAVDLRVKVPHVKWRAIEPQWVPRPVNSPEKEKAAMVETHESPRENNERVNARQLEAALL